MCYVSGISIVAPFDELDELELINKVIGHENVIVEEYNDLKEYESSREFRRMDRISMLGLEGHKKLIEDYKLVDDSIEHYGTIMNTTFGSLETNIAFCKEIVEGRAESISPISFSHTVSNAALGHVCKMYGLKGPSTLMISSNVLRLAKYFLQSGKTDTILISGVDQYYEALYELLKKRGVKPIEASVSVVITNNENRYSYCKIETTAECNLGGHPYFVGDEVNKIYTDNISEILKRALSKNVSKPKNIRYVVLNDVLERVEKKELIKALGISEDCKFINVNKSVGEVFGATQVMNLSIAYLLCKFDFIEYGDSILTCSIDLSGNIMSEIVSKQRRYGKCQI